MTLVRLSMSRSWWDFRRATDTRRAMRTRHRKPCLCPPTIGAVLLPLFGLPRLAQAAPEDRFYVNLGIAGVFFDTAVKVDANGQRVSGASATATNNSAFLFELGYRLSPNISLSTTAGVPPTTKLSGAGSLSSAGKLGKVTYAPAILAVKYQVTRLGWCRPYAGIGVAYTIIFNADDGSLRHLQASDAFGPALVVGSDFAVARHTRIYIDAKKILTYSDARFLIAAPSPGALGTARVHLDPTIIDVGIGFSF